MSVTMHPSGLSLTSSSFSRGTGGAKKTSYSRPVAGSTTSSSSFSSTRTSKPLSRSLPYGPGPTLPNRPTIDHGKFKFIASHSGTTTSRERTSHVNSCHRPSAKNSATTQRKASDDSGYGSSGKDNAYANNNYKYGSLDGRRSKSLSQLHRDETIDSSLITGLGLSRFLTVELATRWGHITPHKEVLNAIIWALNTMLILIVDKVYINQQHTQTTEIPRPKTLVLGPHSPNLHIRVHWTEICPPDMVTKTMLTSLMLKNLVKVP